MSITQLQNTFTLGELDPLLLARVDFEGYYKGARKVRNALAIPQGGLINRFGSLFVSIIVDSLGTVISDETHVLPLVFTYSKTKNYLQLLRPFIENNTPGFDTVSIDIYSLNVLVATLNPADGVPWTVSEIETMRYLRATDRTLFMTGTTAPYQLVNGGNDATWAISIQNFLYYPQFDFSNRDGGVAIYTGPTVTFTPSAVTGAVTITVANATPVTSNHIGGLFYGNGGILRITAVASTTSFSGFTIEDFTNTTAIRGDRSLLTEPAWGNGGGVVPGAVRGWPRVATIFQNRLIYGNSPSLPNVLWASVVFNFNNFDDSLADADYGFSYALGSDSLNEITHLMGSTSLIAITTNSMFSTSVLLDTALTPANVFMSEQNREGSNEVLAQIIDDQILYVADHGTNIKTVEFDLLQSRFKTSDASLLSPHLIRHPRQAATYENPVKSQGNLYMVVNGDDGTLAVYNTLKDQNVSAWTLCDTQGEYIDICANRSECYTLVRRQLPGVGNNQAVLRTNPGFDSFTDITDAIAVPVSGTLLYVDFPSTEPEVAQWTGDYLLVGNSSPFTNLGVSMSFPTLASIVPTFEYLARDGRWLAIDAVLDTTDGFGQTGTIIWDDSAVFYWGPMEINGIPNKFWIRIKRTVNTPGADLSVNSFSVDRQEAIFIEQVAFDYLMDCSAPGTTDIDGLLTVPIYLSGQQVWALEQTGNHYGFHEGIPHGPYVVDESGQINIGENWPMLDFVVGVWSPPLIELMPPTAQFSNGVNVYLPKYIQSMWIDYFEAAGIIVANREIPVLRISQVPALNVPLTLKTNFWEINPYPDRNPRVVIPITTVSPLPFTIIGVGYKIEVS